jgi:hypothetical protein
MGREVLVEHVFLMDALHDVGANDGVQVGLHEVEDQVNILIVLCLQDVQQRYDVRVSVQLLQEDHLLSGK